MVINETNMKVWSRIGSRATFGITALELAATVDNLMVLTADLSTSAGLERFKKTFPDKFLDVGIAEQNMMGIAAGLASEGFKVITTTIAPFQTMRCCEQIRVNLGYMNQNVCMVGLAGGIVFGALGYTHCCLEDVGVMRSIPGITVVSPADCGETVKAILAAIQHKESVYIRLTGGMNNPLVYNDDYNFQIGKAITLREGSDITVVAAGTMVYESLKAADILSRGGISATVINMHTLKPLDTSVIEKACALSKLIVTIEEHSIIGGLGSAVAECKAALKKTPPQIILGLPDQFGKAGEYRCLLENHGLTSEYIAEKIANLYEKL